MHFMSVLCMCTLHHMHSVMNFWVCCFTFVYIKNSAPNKFTNPLASVPEKSSWAPCWIGHHNLVLRVLNSTFLNIIYIANDTAYFFQIRHNYRKKSKIIKYSAIDFGPEVDLSCDYEKDRSKPDDSDVQVLLSPETKSTRTVLEKKSAAVDAYEDLRFYRQQNIGIILSTINNQNKLSRNKPFKVCAWPCKDPQSISLTFRNSAMGLELFYSHRLFDLKNVSY